MKNPWPAWAVVVVCALIAPFWVIGSIIMGRDVIEWYINTARRRTMLILTRRPGETIHIGENIAVTVLGVTGHQVRVGIEAPRGLVIDRAEIRERKRLEALRARPGGVDGNVSPVRETVAANDDDAKGNR